MKDQIKNNELIAEFMGIVFHDDENQYYDSEGFYIGRNLPEYHKDWNELHNVIDTIKDQKLAKEEGLHIIDKIDQGLMWGDKEETCDRCVEFIKFYNQTKTK